MAMVSQNMSIFLQKNIEKWKVGVLFDSKIKQQRWEGENRGRYATLWESTICKNRNNNKFLKIYVTKNTSEDV